MIQKIGSCKLVSRSRFNLDAVIPDKAPGEKQTMLQESTVVTGRICQTEESHIPDLQHQIALS